MDYDYSELVQQSKDWASQLLDGHWLDAEQLSSILTLETNTPKSLLSLTDARPLIVAFMGGTGVGKSSLLNRLAAKTIARTGIERPTSHEVTLYHHQSQLLQNLPSHLPLDKIKISSHSDIAHQNIIWIDMPDFDSTELANKRLVLQWLPHIDVLIYVVSPDRYRDNQAWQLLLAEGQNHGWLFVLNQWDLGQQAQYDDFKKQLIQAGFNNPLIFRSSCTEQTDDEFIPLLDNIKALATKQSVEQLEQHSLQVKKQQLKQILQQSLPLLGVTQNFSALNQSWQQQWQQTEHLLNKGFLWALTQYANQYIEKDAQLLAKKSPIDLWDQWAQNRFDDALDELILTADQLQLATIPLRESLQPIRTHISQTIDLQVELSCRQALVNPGHTVHRLLLKLSRFCEIVLPLITMGVVGYQLLLGFYHGAQNSEDYLGLDFAIHSLLLILISWLLPYFIHKKMQPSIEKAALKGLKKGLTIAFEKIMDEVSLILEGMAQQQQQFIDILTMTIEQCHQENNETTEKPADLARILIDKIDR